MTLDDIPEFVFSSDEDGKFIVVKLKSEESTKLIVRTGDRHMYHREILSKLPKEWEDNGILLCCIGGGKISININQKSILLWDYSYKYSKEPDRQETIRLIQSVYPDFKVQES